MLGCILNLNPAHEGKTETIRFQTFAFLIVITLPFFLTGCVVNSECMSDRDCEGNEFCRDGECVVECSNDSDCKLDETCNFNRCFPAMGCQGCPYPDAPHGQAICEHGNCKITGCDEDWHNADGESRNGCECTPTNDDAECVLNEDGVWEGDGIDNNCNGLTDEGCTCTITNGGVEKCDGIDNDCDNLIDEDLGCLNCTDDMVTVNLQFCIDIYEASRPDATAESDGEDNSKAASKALVMPWMNISQPDAQTACVNAGKRLCNPSEWFAACRGPNETTYCYGDDYEPATCNGIDAFCEVPEYGCGIVEYPFRMELTGGFEDCTNAFGVYDITGNAWEWDSDVKGHGRGGAYNCSDSKKLHRCDWLKTDSGPSATANIGFRCCK